MRVNRIVLNPVDFAQAGRDLMREGVYHVGGSSSIWIPQGRKKLLLSTHCRRWTDLEGEIVMMTSGEAARVELRRAFPGLTRVGWARGHVSLFDHRPPIHFEKPTSGQMTYIDLTAAYCQIYRQLWLDTPFPRGYGRLSLRPIADALEAWKQARNAVIGVTRSRVTYGIRGSNRSKLRIKNPFLSPGLWATVQSILHEIAQVAVYDCHCTYLNTDGYIFTDLHGLDVFKEFLGEAGLNYSEIAGYGDIKGWNSYQVGSRETGLYKLGLPGGQKGLSNVGYKKSVGFVEYWSGCRDITRRGGIGRKADLRQANAGV
jgi:hypothetical protein